MLPADIARCTDGTCPHRHTCRRWTEPAVSDRQDTICPALGPEPCPHYMPPEPAEWKPLHEQEIP